MLCRCLYIRVSNGGVTLWHPQPWHFFQIATAQVSLYKDWAQTEGEKGSRQPQLKELSILKRTAWHAMWRFRPRSRKFCQLFYFQLSLLMLSHWWSALVHFFPPICDLRKLNIEDDMASLVRSLKNRSSQAAVWVSVLLGKSRQQLSSLAEAG